MKYILELNEQQLKAIQIACEFYSRFCAGQWVIPDEMQFKEYDIQDKCDGFWNKRNYVEEQMLILKQHFTGMHLHESYGIGSDKLCEGAKVCYDIYRPILEQFAKEYNEKNPDRTGFSVYDSPGLSYSKQGRITLKQ